MDRTTGSQPLVVWGKQDPALGVELAERMCTQHCDEYTLQYIDRCTHWEQQERPEDMNTFIRQFLNMKSQDNTATPSHNL